MSPYYSSIEAVVIQVEQVKDSLVVIQEEVVNLQSGLFFLVIP